MTDVVVSPGVLAEATEALNDWAKPMIANASWLVRGQEQQFLDQNETGMLLAILPRAIAKWKEENGVPDAHAS